MAHTQTLTASRLLGGAAVLISGAALAALLAPVLYRADERAARAARGWTTTPAEAREARAAQEARIARYAWIDKQTGVVALPIERAMELSVKELAPGSGGGGQDR